MNENPLYKKAYFQCARRAILENEVFMKKFIVEIVKDNYSDEKLERLNEMLTKMYDNDMFDLIMGSKTAQQLKSQYDFELCSEIEKYAIELREKGEAII